jgi:hypothetical protein
VEALLVHLFSTILAVPSQAVQAFLGTFLFQDDAHSILEPYGVMRGVGRQQKHVAFVNVNVAELAVIDDLEQHGALVLVEPLGSFIDMVVGAFIRTTHNHHSHAVVVYAVVVDWRFEHVRVLGYPVATRSALLERIPGMNKPFWDVEWDSKVACSVINCSRVGSHQFAHYPQLPAPHLDHALTPC